MIESLSPWAHFLASQAQSAPLVFLNGVRHTVKPGVCCAMHSHQAIEIVFHPTGRGVTRLKKNRAVGFEESGVVVYAPNESHDQVMETHGEDLCITIGIPAGLQPIPKKCFYVPAVMDAALVEDIRLLSRGQVRSSAAEQAIFNLRATSILHGLVHLACSRENERDDHSPGRHVQKAEQYIRDHFSTIKTLRETADHLGISYDYLRHMFKEQHGKSPVVYLNEIRMDRAKTLLVHSRIPLKQVATMCGFADEYYFSAVFRKFTGVPPGRYRSGLVKRQAVHAFAASSNRRS